MIIMVVVLVVFGPKKLPELARLLGKGMAEFRKATYDLKSAIDLEEIKNYEPPRPQPRQLEDKKESDTVDEPVAVENAYDDDAMEMPDEPESESDPDPQEATREANDSADSIEDTKH